MNYVIRRINWENLDCVGVGVLGIVATLWTGLLLMIAILVDLTTRVPFTAIALIPIGFLTIAFAFLTCDLIKEKFLK